MFFCYKSSVGDNSPLSSVNFFPNLHVVLFIVFMYMFSEMVQKKCGMAFRKSVEYHVLVFMKNDCVCGIFSHDRFLVTQLIQ